MTRTHRSEPSSKTAWLHRCCEPQRSGVSPPRCCSPPRADDLETCCTASGLPAVSGGVVPPRRARSCAWLRRNGGKVLASRGRRETSTVDSRQRLDTLAARTCELPGLPPALFASRAMFWVRRTADVAVGSLCAAGPPSRSSLLPALHRAPRSVAARVLLWATKQTGEPGERLATLTHGER